MSGPAVLVTGGAGYIGSHTCKALHAAGYTPVAFDNLVAGHREAVRWGPFEYGDVANRARLDEVLLTYRPRAALHFAAHAYVGESMANPGKYYRNNAVGSLTLLEALRDHGVRDLVFSSSCAVYGVPETVPITEDTPTDPINPYGMSKLVVERMLRDFQSAHDLRWVALRYFNAAGADPAGEIGEDHDPETRVIPLALFAAAGKCGAFRVFGSDYPTPDGTCIRDYIHVSDLAGAHVRALAALQAGLAPAALNLGVGHGSSVKDIICTVEQVTGLPVPVVNDARRPGDPAVLVADASQARRLLDWAPSHGSLAEIVETAWNWHRHR
ncbi:UDP-glucose 4-epimerase GalE [Breoghania sp.]|uniref:UDP-glucose 4-epimerase GalE n=1 Tax=Breoghania sp. TaxID=2065378 RepID=UPI002AA6B7D2|nr:UDP-glucose 4-epimerase GalE [Breoghania sp.]